MRTSADLRDGLTSVAIRSAAVRSACANEESTKLNLVLPFIVALGYDYRNPFEVQPEYAADLRNDMRERVDFVIMRDGVPVIAIECKKAGSDLSLARGQLRAYFAALPTVHLGILTDGLIFEFFVDSEAANVMDSEPFLTLDMEAATRSAIPNDVVEALMAITRPHFQPEVISQAAEARLLAKRLRSLLLQEIREPSEDFCLHLLQRLGLRNVRRATVQSRYSSLVRSAFEQALVLPILDTFRTSRDFRNAEGAPTADVGDRIVTTDRELAVYRYVCRRLAYLCADEHQFAAIERVQYRDYVGKFAVYYENVRKGRLFDFIAGDNGYDKFVFPEPYGEVVTNAMIDVDEPLRAVFTLRVRELGSSRNAEQRLLQIA
jgi:hypothetical protein